MIRADGQSSSPRQESEHHKEMSDEPASPPTELDAALHDHIKILEQKNHELQDCNNELVEQSKELEKEKKRYAKKAEWLEITLQEKREQFWDEIGDLQDALKAKTEQLQEALDSKAEHRRAESELREELGSLRQLLRDQQTDFAQATTKANEQVQEANEKEARLNETMQQLEKRLQGLNKLIRDQQASFSLATAQSNENVRDANEKQALLKELVEQLEKRLQQQSKEFEDERKRLSQQAAKSQDGAQMELTSSLDSVVPQLRELLSVYDRVRVNDKCQQVNVGKRKAGKTHKMLGQASNVDISHCLKEQESAFDQERALLLEQASDAAKTQRDNTLRNLMEREGVLTCPISLELLEFPVVTGCCGKTFSSEGLRQAIKRSPLCPFCRERLPSTHPNRDMAKLVEFHRRERSLLGLSGVETPTSTVPAPDTTEYAVLPTASTGRAHNRHRTTGSSTTRQSQHREHRAERIQARSNAPHRRSSTLHTQANLASGTTSTAASSSSHTNVATTAAGTGELAQPRTSGLSVYTIGNGTEPTLVQSVLASLRFPSARSRSTTSGRRQRSRSRTASSAASTMTSASATIARQRVRSSASCRQPSPESRAVPKSAAAALPNVVSNATTISTSQSTRSILSRPTTSAAHSASVAADMTSAASRGAALASMPFPATTAVPSASSGAAASASQLTSSCGDSRAAVKDPSASMDAYMKAWVRAQPDSVASSVSNALNSRNQETTAAARDAASTTASSALSTPTPVAATTTTSRTSQRLARVSASQDDSTLGRQRHDAPRLAASQPAPRQPLSSLAQSITSLEDLLGSDFESNSDSDT